MTSYFKIPFIIFEMVTDYDRNNDYNNDDYNNKRYLKYTFKTTILLWYRLNSSLCMVYNVFENCEVENKWPVISGCRSVRNI